VTKFFNRQFNFFADFISTDKIICLNCSKLEVLQNGTVARDKQGNKTSHKTSYYCRILYNFVRILLTESSFTTTVHC